MSQAAEHFASNIRVLLAFSGQNQSELADIFGVPKTTINKWLSEIVTPRDETLLKLAEIIKKDIKPIANPSLLNQMALVGDPYKFATILGLPLYKAHAATAKPVLHSSNLEFSANDRDLHGIVGVYRIFYPSVVYRGAFFAAALRIINDDEDGLFYFEMTNRSTTGSAKREWQIQKLYQFGSVGRLGSKPTGNAILVGDLIGEDNKNLASVRFTSFKIPSSSKPKQLIGTTVGLDFNPKSDGYGHLLPTPIVALSVGEALDEAPVHDFAPSKAYYDVREMKELFPEAVTAIQNAPKAWCFSEIQLEAPCC